MAKNDRIFIIFEISAKFCQKATNSPPKKIIGKIGLKFGAHLLIYLVKKIKKFFVKFWQILAQISKKYGILIIRSRTLKITPSGGSPKGFHPPQDPHNGPPNTVLDILESHKIIIKRQILWSTLIPTVCLFTFYCGIAVQKRKDHSKSFMVPTG